MVKRDARVQLAEMNLYCSYNPTIVVSAGSIALWLQPSRLNMLD